MPTPGSTAGVASVWPMPRMNTCAAELLPVSVPYEWNWMFGAILSRSVVPMTCCRSQRVGAERGHGDRRVLQAFFAPARGDDDGLEGLGGSARRHGRLLRGPRDGDGRETGTERRPESRQRERSRMLAYSVKHIP